MKTKYLIICILLFISTIFIHCSQSLSSANGYSKNIQLDTIQAVKYPNQDSELALLMREMDVDANKMKEAILAGKIPSDFREKFTKIHTAIPTDASSKNEAFEALAKNFLTSLDKVYTSEDKISSFNLMVNACLSCHTMACPGPIVRIKKLTIQK